LITYLLPGRLVFVPIAPAFFYYDSGDLSHSNGWFYDDYSPLESKTTLFWLAIKWLNFCC
jgi:hypothetical protein